MSSNISSPIRGHNRNEKNNRLQNTNMNGNSTTLPYSTVIYWGSSCCQGGGEASHDGKEGINVSF